MNPEQLAKSDTEHAHQSALFCWANMAANYGFDAANDMCSYESKSFVESTYGTINGIEVLHLMHAVPNGGSRGDSAKSRAIRGMQLKAEGVKPGVPDIFLPVPRWNATVSYVTFGKTAPFMEVICGLYIEMKKPSQKPKRKGAGGVSDEQAEYMENLLHRGYACKVCYSWQEAANIITEYLRGE